MTISNYKKIRAEVLNYINQIAWQSPHAITLTLKQASANNGRIDEIKASDTLKHFCNRVNRSLLGRSAVRNGQRLPCFSVYEGTVDVRPHYHLCLDRPSDITYERFVAEIHTAWAATHFGYREIEVKPCTNVDGWLEYMTKRRTKTDFQSSIDWNNTTRVRS